MKKYLILITVLMGIVFGLSACTSASKGAKASEEETTVKEKTWSEEDIDAMFYSIRENDWVYIDSVLTPDHAYDRVGAVLFWDDTEETSNVAFFDTDGYCQQAGVVAATTDEPNFTYLGNGAVSFNLVTDQGKTAAYTLTFSMDDGNVHFTINENERCRC